MLHVGLPGNRHRKQQRLQRECVEQGVEPVLRDHQEADENEAARQEMCDVEGEPASHRYRLLETNNSSVPSRPSINAPPTKSGRRNTRILAITVSKIASNRPNAASLAR